MALRSRFPNGSFFLATAVAVALLLATGQSDPQAGQQNVGAAAGNALPDPAFKEWLEDLRQEARQQGVSETTLDAALGDVAPLMRVIELDRRQPEFTQTFWTYLDQRVTDERVRRGRELLTTHGDLLNEIGVRYGVPPRYLIAFWGLETNFGDFLGEYRVVDTLATLAYDRRRPAFFRGELINALKIIDQGHILPDTMLGSWAGAMGQMQFIPSTFLGHAVDYTGDGRKDIWGSLPDAFASAANYLSNMGWRSGEIWGREVRLPAAFDLMLATMHTEKTIAEWSALGVRRADGGVLPQTDIKGAVVLPQSRQGPAFLVYDNFRVIMRWNRSLNYAISVGHLADRIAGRPPLVLGRQAAHTPLSRDEIEEMQQLLNRLGFDAGPPDGLAGPRTQEAIRAFQRKHSLPPDGYPSPAVLERLRKAASDELD